MKWAESNSDFVRFHHFPLVGIDPMTASTARSFPRHTHDQYGVGVVDSGAHRSWSDRETAFLKLFAHLHKHSTGGPVQTHGPSPSIRRVLSRIDDDPTSPLTLALLAQDAGLSRYQLIRGFARELGLTPHAYILQRRIALARRLILAGQDLAEIALTCGFCDQSHLNRCFVRHFGVTPGRYGSRAALHFYPRT
jgi:AraC-like DNA-binding protein